MIFPDVQAILGFHAFIRDTGTDDFAQPINIDRMHVEGFLDLQPHGMGPRLGAEYAHLQRGFPRVAAGFDEGFQNIEHVGRGHHDALGLEIGNQFNLLIGLTTAHWNRRTAQLLDAVMRTQTACKQAISIGVMDHIPRSQPRCPQTARNHGGPNVNIASGIADDGRLPRGAR